MAQLPRPQDPAAIFSPSVARIAASTARDWSYVDSWLAQKFTGRPVPNFERNADTLKVLLALASHNESADEERHMLHRADAAALEELTRTDPVSQEGSTALRDGLLTAIEHHVPVEGNSALEAMALMALQAGVSLPTPQDLAQNIISLQGSIHQTEQMQTRTEILLRHVKHQEAYIQELSKRLQTQSWKPSPHLAKQNLEIQRKVKTMSIQLSELRDRVSAFATSLDSSQPTLQELVQDESEYLAILEQKKKLDQQIALFQGLPSDADAARAELDSLRRQLRGVTSRRDAVFEGLVERESPVKRR
ncbi:hypothetical protein HJFPF1_12919 [Paramyrothecium foliicola]|nr:hypothetical protein HJFPF1_12919 [Paramyrothecium foliicola]